MKNTNTNNTIDNQKALATVTKIIADTKAATGQDNLTVSKPHVKNRKMYVTMPKIIRDKRGAVTKISQQLIKFSDLSKELQAQANSVTIAHSYAGGTIYEFGGEILGNTDTFGGFGYVGKKSLIKKYHEAADAQNKRTTYTTIIL